MTNATIVPGDNLVTLRGMPDNGVDAVVTDPPYGLSKQPDTAEVLRHWLAGDDYQHTGGGFMGKAWDSFVPGPALWREVIRVLKPGGHVLSFSGTRTYDLMAIAMRLAGFEIRDQLAWLYGTGFPKSLDFGKGNAASKEAGERVPKPEFAEHPCDGFGTALKPAQEPIVLARKPLIGTVARNVLEHGTGGLNVDGCRIEGPGAEAGRSRHGGGLMLGASWQMPDSRSEMPAGRWPANVLLDETAAAALDEQSGYSKSPGKTGRGAGGQHGVTPPRGVQGTVACPSDSGGASRFFYVAKAGKAEREAGLDHLRKASAGELTGGRKEGSAGLDNPRTGAGRTSSGRANTHPTVKPIALMRYLVRLVTPPGGLVLDPYAGSGTTGIAAVLEGFPFLGCELSDEYCTIAKARIAHHAEHGKGS